MHRKSAINWIYVFSVLSIWTLIAIYLAFASLFMAGQGGLYYSLTTVESLFFEILCISPWALSTPFIIRLARRHSFSKFRIWRSIYVHIFAALIVFIFHSLMQSYAVSLFFDIDFSWSYIKIDFIGFIEMRILLYTGILLGVYAFDFYKKNKDSMLSEPRIRAELNKLSFQEILHHLQPEFLIGSIDTIKQKIKTSPRQAENSLHEVSSLLRMMVQNIKRDEATIQEDLKLIDLYLDIIQKRLGIEIERFYHIENACYNARIPNFILIMPFMEGLIKFNEAIRHKLKKFTTKGWVKNGTLFLESMIEEIELATEDLIELNKNVKLGEILVRLHAQYGEDVQLYTSIENRKIRIHMNMPYRKQKEGMLIPHNKSFGNAAETKL